MTKSNDIISILFGIVGLVGIGYAIGAHTKLAKVSERLDRSINDIADNMEFDIPEELISKAVDEAVNTEARKAVNRVTNETISELKRDVRSEVQRAIDKEYDNLKDTVLKEITVQASKIDVGRVRRSVEEALDKFDDNLDDILEKFNDNLTNTSKIYSSIRETLAKNSDSGKEFVVRLN